MDIFVNKQKQEDIKKRSSGLQRIDFEKESKCVTLVRIHVS